MNGFLLRRTALKSRCVIGPEIYAVCRRVRAAFSPNILQAGAVKGLKKRSNDVSRPFTNNRQLLCLCGLSTETVEKRQSSLRSLMSETHEVLGEGNGRWGGGGGVGEEWGEGLRQCTLL